MNVPVLYCGGGEGAALVEEYGLGLTSPPGDFKALMGNIMKIRHMTGDEYAALQMNCRKAASEQFNFDHQMHNLLETFSSEQ